MNDEAAFLARIRDTPDDVAPRLVYADWLDERDDPRGELIRVVEEMRTLAPYSDAYWTLKPRRKALREGVADDWLEGMRYNDVWPIFTHEFPDDWKGRWRLIREFVERWHRVEMPDVGRQADAVAEAEKIVVRKLGPSVSEFVAFVADLDAANTRTAQLLACDYIFRLSEFHPTVSLSRERGAWYSEVVVNVCDLERDDPPVDMYRSEQLAVQYEPRGALIRVQGSPYFPTVSEYMLHDTLDMVVGDGGGINKLLADVEWTALQPWLATFPTHFTLDRKHIFEKPNWLVRIEHGDRPDYPMRIFIELGKQLAKEDIPSVVWDCCKGSHELRGLFWDETRRG
jgi:uncharacterized protein (TIGR02996 family)